MDKLKWSKPAWSGLTWNKTEWGGGEPVKPWDAVAATPKALWTLEKQTFPQPSASFTTVAYSDWFKYRELSDKIVEMMFAIGRQLDQTTAGGITSFAMQLHSDTGSNIVSSIPVLRTTVLGNDILIHTLFTSDYMAYICNGMGSVTPNGYAEMNNAGSIPDYYSLSHVLGSGLDTDVRFGLAINDTRTGAAQGNVYVHKLDVRVYEYNT